MPLFGKIVVIRRDGADGAQFPLTATTCVFGRNADCDIRVQLPNVAREHCRIEIDSDGKIFLVNLCPMFPTLLNKKAVTERVQVQHMDVFTVTDRSFRVEFPPGSPFRKGRPFTNGSISPVQATDSVQFENVKELQAVQQSALPVEDEKSLLSISIKSEQSAAEEESSYSKMGNKCTPKVITSDAKSKSPSYSVCTPLNKGKTASPALRSSAKSKAKTPVDVKLGTRTPFLGQIYSISRTRNTGIVTPKSKTPVSMVSSKSNSALLADEIAELKLALTKHKDQSKTRNSILKTPLGSSKLLSSPVKAKTAAVHDKIKTPSVTPRVQSNTAQILKTKTPTRASIVKIPMGIPAAKAPVSTPRSKGLAAKTSSVHRVKKVMTPPPRAKTPAQKRRTSSIPTSGPKIAKKTPLRNILTQTDSLDASQDQQEAVDSNLETLFGDKTSNETVSSADDRSQNPNLSPAKTGVHQKKQSPKNSFLAEPSTRRNSLSPLTRSLGSSLTRSKSQSLLRSLAKSSPQKMSQSPEILTKKLHSSRASDAGVNEFAKQSPLHQMLSQASNLTASLNCTEAVDSIPDTSFGDKTTEEAVSSDEKSKSMKLSPAKAHTYRKSRSSKVSPPAELSAHQLSQSPNIVEAHTGRKILIPTKRSPASSSTRSKSQSPSRGSTESSTDRLSQSVEIPAQQLQSSSRPNVGANKSPLHELSLQASSPNVLQAQAKAVDFIVATSFADMTSNEIFSLTDEKLQRSVLSPVETRSCRISQSFLTRSPSIVVTRSKSQSPFRNPAELSAQKKLQSSQMSPVDDITYRKLHIARRSPNESSCRKPQSPKLSSTRSKSQGPLRSPTATSADRSLRHSTGHQVDPLTRSKSLSPMRSAAESSAHKYSQSLEAFSPSKTKDSIPVIIDECSDSYEQPFSPLILEMDDIDENKDCSKKSTPISNPLLIGGSDPGLPKPAVGRSLKSQLLLEESEGEIANAKSAANETDTSLKEFGQTFAERSFLSHSQGVKRPGSPLTRCRPKRFVSFGPNMSPELFDQSLPVATPLKRGATPRRASTSVDQNHVWSKPLLKIHRSTLSTAASVLQEEPVKATSEKSSKYLNTVEKISAGDRQGPVPESVATLNSEALAATDLEPSQPVITPLKRETKACRASVSQADVHPKLVQKSRRATTSAAGVIPEALLEENFEKSPKGSKAHQKERAVMVSMAVNVDAYVLTTTDVQTTKSPTVLPVTVETQAGLQYHTIFTSRTGARRLSKELKTQPAAEATTSNENSLAVKTLAKKETTPKLRQSLPSRSSHPLTSVQNSSMLLQEYDPFAFESSPESSPTKLMPNLMGLSKNDEVNTVVSEELAVSKSAKKKSLSKSQEVVATPKFPLDFTAGGSATSVKSSKSVGKRSVKDVSLEQEHELPIMPMTVVPEGLKLDGRRLSKPKPVTEVDYETPAMATPNNSRSVGRRSARFLDKEHISEATLSLNKSSSRRSSFFRISSAKADGQALSDQVSTVEEKIASSRKSAAKTSTDQRKRVKSDKNLTTPNAEMTVAGSPVVSAGDSTPTPRRFSERKSSSPFKRTFGSEPRKLRSEQFGQLFRLSLEEARKLIRNRNTTRQMISERNIDLSSLSPVKFYKSPAAEAFTGKWSKVTPGRAVALRAVYGKSAVPPLAELCLSREALAMRNKGGSATAEMPDDSTKLSPAEKSSGSKVSKRKMSAVQVIAKKSLAKKTGFAVKKKQTKVLLLKTKVGRKSVGQVAKRLLAAGRKNQRVKSDKALCGQNSLPNIAENDVLQFLPEKDQTLDELSKSPSSCSIPQTPNGPGEMSVSPWSSPILVSIGKRRSSAKMAGADGTSEGQKTQSCGIKGQLVSPTAVNSPNVSGLKLLVKTPKIEASQLNGIKQLVKTPKVETSPQLSGVRKLVKTPKVQKSPQLSGIRNLVKTPKVQKSPQLSGIRNLMKTPKVQKFPQLSGIRNLVKTPKVQKSPQLSGIRNLVKTLKVQKSPQLSGIRNLMKTPKVQKSPLLSGIRNLVKTPKVQKSPLLSGVKNLVMTPKMQKSPKLSSVRKLVKTPEVQKSPQLSGVKNLLRAPKVQKSPDLTGVKALVKTPRQRRSPRLGGIKEAVLSSPDLTGLRELVKSPATKRSRQLSGICKTVKTPKPLQSVKVEENSPRLSGVKALVKTPKTHPSPKLSGMRTLVCMPKEILSPELEVQELIQNSVMQPSAKRQVESHVKSPEVVESMQFGEKPSSSKIPAMKESTPKVKSTNKPWKSFVTPIFTEMKAPQESARVEDVTSVRQMRRPRKFSSHGVERVEDIQKPSLKNVDRGVNVKEGETAADKTRKRKNVESDEKPAAKKQCSAIKTEEQPADDNKKIGGNGLPSAAKKRRGSKVAEKTRPSEFEVTGSVPKARGRLHKERSGENSTLQVEQLQVTSAALSPKLAGDKNSTTQRVKTTQFEQMTMEENVDESVQETVKFGGRRKGRSSKKDLTEEAAVHSESRAENKIRAKGKSKAMQAEVAMAGEQVTVAGIVEVSVPSDMVKSDGRRQCRAKKNATEEVAMWNETVGNKAERKTRARGKGITKKEELASEQVTAEEYVESSVAVKVGDRQQGRAKNDVNEEVIVQSKTIVNKPKRKGRGKVLGKATHTEFEITDEVTVEENVEASVQETVKLGGRQQDRLSKKVVNEEAAVQSEIVLNKAGKKAGGRGKAKIQLAETVEENLEEAVRPNTRNKKQTAKEDAVHSDTEETSEVKRPVRGRGIKSEGEKAKRKSKPAASEEAAPAADNKSSSVHLNKGGNAAEESRGKRGRKGTVQPVSSDAELITEAVRYSRKRKARTVEDIVPAETKRAKITVEAVAIGASIQVSSLKPSRRGSLKETAGGAQNKDGGMSANKNHSTSDNAPAVKHAGRCNKRKTEICKVSSTTAEEIKKNSLETKRGKSSAKSAESSEGPLSKNTVTAHGRNTMEQTSDEVAFKVDLPSKGKARKVKFDIPLPAVSALEKAPQSTAHVCSVASKRGSDNKSANKELCEKKPKACVSRRRSPVKDTTPAKRTMRSSRK